MIRSLQPWLDSQRRALLRVVRRLERKFRRTSNPVDRLTWIDHLRKMQHEFHDKETAYWETLIEREKWNSRRLLAALSCTWLLIYASPTDSVCFHGRWLSEFPAIKNRLKHVRRRSTLHRLRSSLRIFREYSVWIFRACAMLVPNPGALPTLVPQLRTVFHDPCAWNYYRSHLSSYGNALGASCSLAQVLTQVESAADLSYTPNLTSIALLWVPRSFAFPVLIAYEVHFC